MEMEIPSAESVALSDMLEVVKTNLTQLQDELVQQKGEYVPIRNKAGLLLFIAFNAIMKDKPKDLPVNGVEDDDCCQENQQKEQQSNIDATTQEHIDQGEVETF